MEDFEMCQCDDNDEDNENEDMMCTGASDSCEVKDSGDEDLMCKGAFDSSKDTSNVSLQPVATCNTSCTVN